MKAFITAILSLFLIVQVTAQDADRLQSTTFYSEAMDQQRTLRIYLPKDYSDKELYPVIYITDGTTFNFNVAANYLDGLSEPYFNLVPQSILVGIEHNVRNDDLDVWDSESGKRFMEYLFDEAVPHIDSTYSTSGFNAMLGHSNGAEYNHFLMMAEDNPFAGFISMSTSLNTDVRDRLTSFFQNYEGRELYYFIANATYDSPERPQYGNEIADLYRANPNPSIQLANKTYEANHVTVVPTSLFDGIRFIFQDYYAIGTYDSFTEYRKKYLSGIKEIYGVDASYRDGDLENYMMDIIINKKVEEYDEFAAFIEENKLWMGGGYDPMNLANHYFLMDAYDKAIEQFNDALMNYDSYDERYPGHFKNMFSNMFPKAVKAYENTGRFDEMIQFLRNSTNVLSSRHSFFVNHKIARVANEHRIALDKGEEAVSYCISNYVDNTSVSMDDLKQLRESLLATTAEAGK